MTAEPQTLKISEKQNTQYAIPLWLRDIQIKHAMMRVKARVEPVDEPRSEPVAVVCFGPSLNDTWEKLRGFKYIITCSGAHKFLVDRGIIPTWHVELDPREHKVALIGKPCKETEYWIASTCHKAVFDHLEGYNVKLWHIFDGAYETSRAIPPGEWALTGGCSVGLRTFTCATFNGFRDIHVFGMDGNQVGGMKHAADHPNEPVKHALVEFPEGSGKMWETTASMLEAARQTIPEMEQLSKAKFTFYGEGLVQELVKQWKPSGTVQNIDAIKKPELITEQYRAMNALLHSDNVSYGTSGHRHADTVIKLKEKIKAESILDYGCGKGTLAVHLPFPIWEYDPAIPGKDELPRIADLVLCFDVLEHVEPEMLPNVLAHLAKVTRKVGYFVIATRPAKKTLADGRNAHLIVKQADWWRKKLEAFFDVGDVSDAGGEIHVVVGPRTKGKQAGESVYTLEHDGTTAKFYTPNETTKWRAKSLMTKEPATIEWIDTFKQGETLLDVGANVGGYTVWAAQRRGVSVVAFEPEAGNYALLCRNMALNEVKGTAFCAALSDESKLSELHLATREPGGSCNSFGAAVGFDLKERKSITQGAIGFALDSIIDQVGAPDHIKIDVDGFEFKVIKGMSKLLESGKVKSLLIEVNANLPEHQEMLTYLAGLGFGYDPTQFEKAQRKEGTFKGCGECVFRKVEPLEQYVLDKIRNATIAPVPFPHLYIEDVFPPGFELEMPEEYKSLEEARGTGGYPQRFVAEAPESVAWMRNGRLRALLNEKFGVEATRDETCLLRDKAGYAIPPHTDTPSKVVTALFYQGPEHGTTIYEPVEPGFTNSDGKHFEFSGFREVWTAPAKKNSVLIFARTDNSFHGCKPYDGEADRNILLWDSRR